MNSVRKYVMAILRMSACVNLLRNVTQRVQHTAQSDLSSRPPHGNKSS